MTGNEPSTVSVPPAWSKRRGAARHRSVAPAAIVTLPSLTTWPLMVAGPPAPALMLTLPSAALVRVPEVIARVSP